MRMVRRRFLSAGLLGFSLAGRTRPLAVSVVDYHHDSDGDDFGPALMRAIAASPHVFFPTRPEGYRFATYVSATLTRDTVIDCNRQRLVMDGSRIALVGAVVADGRTLEGDHARYTTRVMLNDTSFAASGDLAFISTDVKPVRGWGDAKQDCVRVQEVCGNTLIMEAGLNFSYFEDDAGLSVSIYRPVGLTILDPIIDIIADDADRTTYVGFLMVGLHNVSVVRPYVFGEYPFNRARNIFRNGLWFLKCWDVSVHSPYYEAVSYGSGAYDGTRNVTETNVRARYCHHAHLDMGEWSSDYSLDGLVSDECYQSVSTHPCFRAYAANFDVLSDFGLPNWRACGGGWRNGNIRSSVSDADPLPEFQNLEAIPGYEYVNEDADFHAVDVRFDVPNRPNKTPFGVRFGRRVYLSGVISRHDAFIGMREGEVGTLVIGPGNEFGPLKERAPSSSLIRARRQRFEEGLVAM